MYLPLFIRSLFGFSESVGIAQYEPIFVAPEIRSSLQRSCILLTGIPRFSDVCLIHKYSIGVFLAVPYNIHPLQRYDLPNWEQNHSSKSFLYIFSLVIFFLLCNVNKGAYLQTSAVNNILPSEKA